MTPVLTFNAGHRGYDLSATVVNISRTHLPMLPAPNANVGTDRKAKTIAPDRKRLKEGEKDGIVSYDHGQSEVKSLQ